MVDAKDVYLYPAATSAKDVILRYQGQPISATQTKTYTIEVLFEKLGMTINYSSDVVLKSLGRMTPYLTDVILQKLNSIVGYLLDVAQQKEEIKAYLIDVLMEKKGVTIEYAIDVLLQKKDEIKIFLIDCLYQQLSATMIYALDAVISKKDAIMDFVVDAVFISKNIPVSYVIDMVFSKANLRQYIVETVLVNLHVSRQYFIDVLIGKVTFQYGGPVEEVRYRGPQYVDSWRSYGMDEYNISKHSLSDKRIGDTPAIKDSRSDVIGIENILIPKSEIQETKIDSMSFSKGDGFSISVGFPREIANGMYQQLPVSDIGDYTVEESRSIIIDSTNFGVESHKEVKNRFPNIYAIKQYEQYEKSEEVEEI